MTPKNHSQVGREQEGTTGRDWTDYTLCAYYPYWARVNKKTTGGSKCTDKRWDAATVVERSRNTRSGKTKRISAALLCVAESGCEPVPCYHPLHGYASKHVNPTGKRSVVFKLSRGLIGQPVSIPCGRCIGCRLELSRQWAMRCVHEAQLHQDSCFITLTYDQENLPYGGTLIKKDYQDFMKRLRKQCGKKIKYYHCGEYGERSRRPHYHALLFGVSFVDQEPFKRSADGSMVYTSASLSRLWPAGFSTVGSVTFESAAYVARYVMKKITGAQAKSHYETIDRETGECFSRLPEYTTMSLKPAIAKDWYSTFKTDVYPSDSVVLRGKEMKPPKYYDRLLELEDPAARALIKERRMASALLRQGDTTSRRLRDREQCKLAQIATLKREVD